MPMKRIHYFVLIVAIALVGAVGIYLISRSAQPAGVVVGGSSATSTTTMVSSTTEIVTTPGGGTYTITQIPISNPPAAPAYKGAITCPSTMSSDQCASIQSQDAVVVSHLSTSTTDFAAWVDLGTLRKEVGDYQGAASAWTYLTQVYPSNATAYANLGDLYANFLQEYPQAEANWLEAIKLNPNDTNPYKDLFTLYTTTSYHPSANSAVNILKQGIAANPNAVDMQVMLARYYKSQGDTTDAEAEYQAAIANAQSQGQTSLAAQIQTESSSQ